MTYVLQFQLLFHKNANEVSLAFIRNEIGSQALRLLKQGKVDENNEEDEGMTCENSLSNNRHLVSSYPWSLTK